MKMVLAVLLMLLGMAQAIPCSIAMPSADENADFDCSADKAEYKQFLANDSSSAEHSAPIRQPCAFCSALCHHAVTLVSHVKVEPILRSYPVSDTLTAVSPPSNVVLDSLKRPPRIS
jgi:hypothetical protein